MSDSNNELYIATIVETYFEQVCEYGMTEEYNRYRYRHLLIKTYSLDEAKAIAERIADKDQLHRLKDVQLADDLRNGCPTDGNEPAMWIGECP